VNLCCKYEKKTGEKITTKTEFEERKIESFLNRQKTKFAKGKLPPEQLEQLRTLETWREWKSSEKFS